MPYFTYILVSQKNGRRYFGSCENLELRLNNHNSGKVKSSKPYRPYIILYFETFDTRSEAYQKEMFFKTVECYQFLKDKGIF